MIDSLYNVLTADGAVDRNSQAWPRWGIYVWPNYYRAQSYDDAIGYLKQWIRDRLAWMDSQLGFDPNEIILGDVDGAGSVTISDVTILIDYILTQIDDNINLAAADYNQDGTIDIADLTEIIDFLLTQ